MVWFKVDDGFPSSKPVTAIARRDRASAVGLWTLAGAWSAKELTDGQIPAHMIREFASTPRVAGILTKVGLWEKTETGWDFRHWSRYQPTRAEVLANRDREAERKRSQRESRRRPTGTPSGREAESEHPDPTRPDPTPTDVPSVGKTTDAVASDTADKSAPKPSSKKKRTQVPVDFAPSDKHREKSAELGVDADKEVEKFRNYHLSKGTLNLRWDTAFNNWLTNAAEFQQQRGVIQGAPQAPKLRHWTEVEADEPQEWWTPEQMAAWDEGRRRPKGKQP